MTALTRLTPAGVPGRRIARRVVTVTSDDVLFYARVNATAYAAETSMQFVAAVGATAQAVETLPAVFTAVVPIPARTR